MRKSSGAILVAIISAALIFGCSKGYESQKSVGDLTVALKADRYPLVKADNALSVIVTDATGKAITDAKVDVQYYMPPMPGMAPMEFSTPTTLKGSAYSFTVKPPMEGGWKVEVTVARPGKPAVMATFNLDVR